MNVFLLRHAQTPGNLQSRYIGSTDEGLAPEGVATARAARSAVVRDAAVARVYTGTLRRAVQTAEILYPGAEIIRHAGLNEMDFGRFEGQTWRELENDADYAAWVASGCILPCPGGESRESFTLRCWEAFSVIVRQERQNDTPALHFVVHGGTIMSVMSGFAEPRRDYFAWKAGFCGGFVMETTPDFRRFQLLREVQAYPEGLRGTAPAKPGARHGQNQGGMHG